MAHAGALLNELAAAAEGAGEAEVAAVPNECIGTGTVAHLRHAKPTAHTTPDEGTRDDRVEERCTAFLSVLLWNFDMYAQAECPDYSFALPPGFCQPALDDLAELIAAGKWGGGALACPRSSAPPPSPHVCGVAMLPASAAACMPAPLRHLFQEGGVLGRYFEAERCAVCADQKARLAALCKTREEERKAERAAAVSAGCLGEDVGGKHCRFDEAGVPVQVKKQKMAHAGAVSEEAGAVGGARALLNESAAAAKGAGEMQVAAVPQGGAEVAAVPNECMGTDTVMQLRLANAAYLAHRETHANLHLLPEDLEVIDAAVRQVACPPAGGGVEVRFTANQPWHMQPQQHMQPQHMQPQHMHPQHMHPQHMHPQQHALPQHMPPRQAQPHHMQPQRHVLPQQHMCHGWPP